MGKILMIGFLCLAMADPALAQEESLRLPTVVVTADKKEGTAEVGYVVKNVDNFGPWGDRAILDTPFSVFSVKAPLIENIQAQSPADVLKIMPNVYGAGQSDIAATMNLSTRGLWTQRNIINGVPTDNAGMGIFVEDLESMTVLSGLSGFMYGQGNVGGLIHYEFKRPTDQFYNKVKIGNYGAERFYAHADLGGPIVRDKLAFRLNIMGQDGDSSVDGQNIKKHFLSGALDWNLSEDLQIQFNASYGKSDISGRQASFTIPDVSGATLAVLPSAPDPSKLWAPDETGVETTGHMFNVGLKYKVNNNLNFRAAFSHQEVERQMAWAAGGFLSAAGDFRYTPAYADWLYKSNGAFAYLDANFNTFGLDHKLTVGANGYQQDTILGRFRTAPGASTYTNAATRPLQFDDFNSHRMHMPSFDSVYNLLFDRRSKLSETFNHSFVLGDEITFNDQWTLMAGLNYATINTKTYRNTTDGSLASDYSKSKLTPSLSLLYKPVPWITTYASYIEALENGSVVGVQYSNAGEFLPPLMSEQYEVGVKAERGAMLLSAALFQIDKGLQHGVPGGRWVQDGRQRYRGLELTGSGKLFEDLTLVGGVTFIDAEVVKTSNRNYVGKRPQYAPKTIAKLYAEYDLPFLDGLTLTGGINYFGTVMANQSNSVELPAYTVGDLGLRYIVDIKGVATTFRLNASNITNQAYWVGNSGSAVYLGEPRNIMLTAEFSF